MAEQKDLNSLDELFRKSFQEMPQAPAANGWDAPSPQVWQNVQATLQPTSGFWNKGYTWLAATAVISLVAALSWYWIASHRAADQPAAPIPNPPTEQPIATPSQDVMSPPTIPTEVPATMPSTTSSGKPTGHSAASQPHPTVAQPTQPTTSSPTEGDNAKPRHSVAAPLPGSQGGVPSNNTERRKQEEAESQRLKKEEAPSLKQ